jgi:hypothetical protein
MKCEQCKRTPAILKCKECSCSFCCGCIQLEVHSCEGINKKKIQDLALLESKLKLVIAEKVTRF